MKLLRFWQWISLAMQSRSRWDCYRIGRLPGLGWQITPTDSVRCQLPPRQRNFAQWSCSHGVYFRVGRDSGTIPGGQAGSHLRFAD